MNMRESIRRNAILLALFSLVTAGGIATTYIGTRSLIASNKRAVEEATLLQILPRSTHNNSMLDDSILVDDSEYLRLASPRTGYIARQDGVPVAVILPLTAPDGYSGAIQLLVGIYRDGSIAGVRAIEHHETPGLGDKVELKKSRWVLGFNGKSIGNPALEQWKVRKDKGAFDQFTGATITPRAVTAAVLNSLLYVQAHHDDLFAEPVASTEHPNDPEATGEAAP